MKLVVVFVLGFVAFASAGCWWRHGSGGMWQYRNIDYTPKIRRNVKTIAGTAGGINVLATLVKAVKAAGLIDTLNGKGTFTVFAPNNAGFAKIPEDELSKLLEPENIDQLKSTLLRHVLGSVIRAEDIPEGDTEVQTLGGEILIVTKSDDGVIIKSSTGTAKVITTNVMASNGVVHVIDTVLQNSEVKPDTRKKSPSIVEMASKTKRLSTLVTAVQKADLVDTLNGEGTFTVFAPDNAAFNKIPKEAIGELLKLGNEDQLRKTLLRHVLGSVVMAKDIPDGSTEVETVGGEKVIVTKSSTGVTVESSTGKANVIATDYLGSNGVVHIIDTVLTNPPTLPTIAEAAISTSFLSTLVTVVQKAGLVDVLNGDGTFTVFAPNDAAFSKVPSDALNELLKEENVDQLKETLLRHVIGSVIKSKDIPEGSTEIQTIGGENIKVSKSDTGVTIESSSGKARVVATDVLGSNGVVHIIDTVLANPSPLPTIAEAAIDAPFLSTLVTAIQKAGLVDTLSGDGTFTVFAPNNAAFDKVPADALNELLKEENINELKETLLRHVVGSVIKAEDIPEGSTEIKTVGGENIKIRKSDAGVTIESSSGKANVIATDVLGSNGVVHVIDKVLTNPSPLATIAEAAIDRPFLSTLVSTLQKAGLVDTLSGEGTFTVFAPNNAAFGKVPTDALNELLKEENVTKLKSVLLRHVLGTVIKADDIPKGTTNIKTVGGDEITVTKSETGVFIESSSGKAKVIATDVLASNGVVHVVDTVF